MFYTGWWFPGPTPASTATAVSSTTAALEWTAGWAEKSCSVAEATAKGTRREFLCYLRIEYSPADDYGLNSFRAFVTERAAISVICTSGLCDKYSTRQNSTISGDWMVQIWLKIIWVRECTKVHMLVTPNRYQIFCPATWIFEHFPSELKRKSADIVSIRC